MKRILWTLVWTLSGIASAYQIGDYVSDRCWESVQGDKICLDDYLGTVRVMDWGAGWCGPCNSKMGELAGKVGSFAGKKVTFFSTMLDGWTSNSGADQEFLTEWKEKHNIPESIHVVSVPRNDFLAIASNGGIPRFSIIDQDSRLVYRASGPSLNEVFGEVNKLLTNGPKELPPFMIKKPNLDLK